jgi:hypothetical protein
MSLASILDKLTSLFSKAFVIGAFLPVLIFAFLNGTLLYCVSTRFRFFAAGPPGVVVASAIVAVGLVVIAYLLSSVNGFLRELLEGKHLPARWKWVQAMVAHETQRRDGLDQAYFRARNEGARIADARPGWVQRLRGSAQLGMARTQYNTYDGANGQAVTDLRTLRGKRSNAQTLDFADFTAAVGSTSLTLATNNIRQPGPGANPDRLGDDHLDLLILMDYAQDDWNARELRAFADRARFGLGAIAPTSLGNAAASLQSYGISRYGINLETFWARLIPVVAAKNSNLAGNIQDAKTQLDFLVASCWLAAATAIGWLLALGAGSLLGPWLSSPLPAAAVWVFLAVALVGPGVVWLTYTLTIDSYVVFSELVRTAVDLYRFSLLQSLRLSLPASLRDERRAWKALQKLATFGQEWVDLDYDPNSKGGVI